MTQALGRLRVGRTLHWATALFAVALGVASDPGTRATMGALFALAGGALVLHAAVRGPLAHPGPAAKRSRAAVAVHLALHRGLLAAVAATVATGLPVGMAGEGVAAALGGAGEATALWHDRAYNALLALAAGHVIFNMWRSSALGEPAFRTMLGSGSAGG